VLSYSKKIIKSIPQKLGMQTDQIRAWVHWSFLQIVAALLKTRLVNAVENGYSEGIATQRKWIVRLETPGQVSASISPSSSSALIAKSVLVDLEMHTPGIKPRGAPSVIDIYRHHMEYIFRYRL
jgi:hypothetical protein